MHLLRQPMEPHFVHLSWAVRRLTPTQAKYIRMFYGAEVLHQIEALEQRGAGPPAPRRSRRMKASGSLAAPVAPLATVQPAKQ